MTSPTGPLAATQGHRGGWGLAVLLLAGCTVPTSSPAFDATWAIPSSTAVVAVGTILPAGLTAEMDRIHAQIATRQWAVSVNVPGTGAVPLPDDMSFTSVEPVDLPAAFVFGTVPVGETMEVRLAHTLPVDLVRWGGGLTGAVRVRIVAGGVEVGAQVVDGQQDSLLPGVTRVLTVPLQGEMREPVSVEVTLVVPAGALVPTALVGDLLLDLPDQVVAFTEATARVVAQPVGTPPVTVTTSDIDQTIRERATSGIVTLTFEHPWTATMTGTIVLRPENGAVAVTTPMIVGEGQTTVAVPVDPSALRLLLASPSFRIEMDGLANGSGDGGEIVVRSQDQMEMASAVTLVLEVGS